MTTLSERIFFLFVCALLSFACNFQYGFSTTYLNTPVDAFKDYFNVSLRKMHKTMTHGTYDWMWDLTLNIWFVGFFFGIWLSPVLNDRYGRKVGFIVGNAFSLVASLLRFAGILWWQPVLLFLGRVIASICTAITYQSLILYLQECAPTSLRGVASFISEISFAFMCLLGMSLGTEQLLGDHLRALVGFAVIPSAISLCVLFFMPETPKYLLITKNDKERAEDSIRFYHGHSADARAVMKEIAQEAEAENDSAFNMEGLREMWNEKHLRLALLLSCSALQNTVALWSILLSSTDFLERSNVPDEVAKWSSTAMTAAYCLGTLIGSTLIERLGRRVLLLTFSFANSVVLITYVVFTELQPVVHFFKYFCLTCLIFYGFTYGTGVGPISWFISSELVPQRYRSLTQSLCYAINTIMVVITTFAVLPLYNAIGSYAFVPLYIIPSAFALTFLYRKLPETKGREIYDIVAELKHGKSVGIRF